LIQLPSITSLFIIGLVFGNK